MSGDVRREDFWMDEGTITRQSGGPKRRRTHHLAVQLYGAISAAAGGSDTPKVPPSLATCEQLSKASAVPDNSAPPFKTPSRLSPASQDALDAALRLGIEDIDRAARLAASSMDAPELMYRLLERGDQERTERALALLEAGEPSAALRFAKCGMESVQLECPDTFGAGGCGHDQNYTPITCDHLLCDTCADRRMGHGVEKYAPAVESWEAPTFYTFTIPNVSDPAKGVEAIKGAFGRLRRRTIPASGETRRDGSQKRWAWANDGGVPADLWKPRLLEAGRHDLARHVQKHYVEQGKQIPFDELVQGGFYGVDVKQKAPDEFNVHLHVLADSAYIPQAALSSVWCDVSGAPVVDVRRIYDRGAGSLEDAVMETVGYAVKAPEFEEVDTAARFAKAMKGKRLVQPFGQLHGNTPRVGGDLLCAECGQTPNWWTYLGVVDERRDTMGSVHDGESSGNDPP